MTYEDIFPNKNDGFSNFKLYLKHKRYYFVLISLFHSKEYWSI